MPNMRDKTILKRMVRYCDDINEIIAKFGDTLEKLSEEVAFRHSVSMCVLQIGELTTHLTKEFIVANSAIPWTEIRKMRNIAAHHYGEFKMEILHKTIIYRVPELRDYCQKLLDDDAVET